MSKLPKLKPPWKELPQEEVDELMKRFQKEFDDHFKDFTVRGILHCLCQGTGWMPVLGGKPIKCPYCSLRLG